MEEDWSDRQALHCCVVGTPQAPEGPREVLKGFSVLDFARWLREHNLGLTQEQRVGSFGLDVYSLWESLNAVLERLRENMPERVGSARELRSDRRARALRRRPVLRPHTRTRSTAPDRTGHGGEGALAQRSVNRRWAAEG